MLPEQMHPDGGWDGSGESRDSSPTTTSPKSRSCWFWSAGQCCVPADPQRRTRSPAAESAAQTSTTAALASTNVMLSFTSRLSGMKAWLCSQNEDSPTPGSSYVLQSVWVLNKTIYCIYSFVFFSICRSYLVEDISVSVGMKSAESLGPGCDFYFAFWGRKKKTCF